MRKNTKSLLRFKNYFLILFCLCLLVLAPSCNKVKIFNDVSFLEDELNSVVIPINSAPLELSNGDLSALEYLGGARIVGLGEATHGTKEFFDMKHRIFKYLVEVHGYKVFAFECDFAESLFFEKYITTGEGDLEDMMRRKMLFWTWCNQEVKALLQWMRDYNSVRAPQDMIHFIGVDCQHLEHYPEQLMGYLQKMSPELAAQVAPMVEFYTYIRDDELAWMQAEVANRRAELIANSSVLEYEIMAQLIKNMIQIKTVKESYKDENDLDPDINYRDMYMAQNTLWSANLYGADTKVAVWAHNGHVANWQMGDKDMMGMHLRKTIGDLYQIVGFSFSEGSFVAYTGNANADGPQMTSINGAPLQSSTSYHFYNCQYDNFILKMDSIPEGTELYEWMHSPRTFIMVGASVNADLKGAYMASVMAEEYDIMINFDFTSASEMMERIIED